MRLRASGLQVPEIARHVEKAESTVKYHLREARIDAARELEEGGRAVVVGESFLALQALYDAALRDAEAAPPGSPQRAAFMDMAARRLRERTKLLRDLGILRSVGDEIEALLRQRQEISGMTIAELMLERDRLVNELAGATLQPDRPHTGLAVDDADE
jgi:hypothetical protein